MRVCLCLHTLFRSFISRSVSYIIWHLFHQKKNVKEPLNTYVDCHMNYNNSY